MLVCSPDRLFKDIVSEMDADVNVAPFVELVAKHMYVLDTHSRQFLVSWVMVLQVRRIWIVFDVFV